MSHEALRSDLGISSQRWIGFIVRLMVATLGISVVAVLLGIVIGSMFGDKNQLIVPTWDNVHKAYQIAFVDAERNITYFRRTDQGQQNPIESNLAWSPDGRQIAFEVLTDADTQIEVMGSSGSPLQSAAQEGVDPFSTLIWSPDSQKIAFVSPTADEIRLTDVQGKLVSPLIGELHYAHSLTWSPDGSQIAFLSLNDRNQDSLRLIHPNGTNLREIDFGLTAIYVQSLAWSPDGKYLAFVSLAGESINIDVVNVETGERRTLDDSSALKGNPVWLPSGDQIIFWEQDAIGFAVKRVNADGSGLTQLTYLSNATCTGLAWSSDGQHIAIGVVELDASKVYLMNADGSGLRDLLNTNTSNSVLPVWRP